MQTFLINVTHTNRKKREEHNTFRHIEKKKTTLAGLQFILFFFFASQRKERKDERERVSFGSMLKCQKCGRRGTIMYKTYSVGIEHAARC